MLIHMIFYISSNSPAQPQVLLQCSVSVWSPVQLIPPFIGAGFEQSLVLFLIPEPQETLHLPQPLHLVKLPLTVLIGIRIHIIIFYKILIVIYN